MKREEKNAARRRSILDAALEVFAVKGFVAARVEDIARAAHVAKGTIYLHFTDKEDIFCALVQEELGAVHSSIVAVLNRTDLTLREKIWRMAAPFLENNGFSRTSKTIRLTHAEGLHNPHLVRHYQPIIIRSVLELAGHLRQAGLPEPLCENAQLFMAPLIHGIIWQNIMGAMAAIDMEASYRLFLDALLPEEQQQSPD